jgi:hypothetical protein
MSSTASTDTVVLRHATVADDAALRDLAALDSARLGPGPHLVAEVDGHLRAAVSLADGATIADPFRPSDGVVALLRARAGGRPATSPARRRLRRPVRRARPLAA